MYKVSIDKKKCIGCGSCAAMCEDIYEMKGDKAIVKKSSTELECAKEAADICPVQAILIK